MSTSGSARSACARPRSASGAAYASSGRTTSACGSGFSSSASSASPKPERCGSARARRRPGSARLRRRRVAAHAFGRDPARVVERRRLLQEHRDVERVSSRRSPRARSGRAGAGTTGSASAMPITPSSAASAKGCCERRPSVPTSVCACRSNHCRIGQFACIGAASGMRRSPLTRRPPSRITRRTP